MANEKITLVWREKILLNSALPWHESQGSFETKRPLIEMENCNFNERIREMPTETKDPEFRGQHKDLYEATQMKQLK